MSLDTQWTNRIEAWNKALSKQFYHSLADVELEGFCTSEQLHPDEAMGRDVRPFPEGTQWGSEFEYGWFRVTVETPAEAAGQRLVMLDGMDCEGLAWVDGEERQSISRFRPYLHLRHEAKAGESIEVLMELYAGNERVASPGPVPPDQPSVPISPENRVRTKRGTIGIWQEEVFQLHIDVDTLMKLREELPEESLRLAEIDEALRDYTLIVDFELPREAFLETCRQARQRLAKVLEVPNGPTAPQLDAFGHGHIDVAWLWPLRETERKIARTTATQLALSEEYEGYRFLQSQPHLYRMLQSRYPALYERVKQAIRDGRIIADGAMWVEADTNITGGESLIRQMIHGRRFFREELGVESEVLWIPDVFGYSGALPQIMRGCGVKYFSTAKLFWAYAGGDPFPYNVFTWEGIDGSEVLVELVNDYNSHTDPTAIHKCWNTRRQKDGIRGRMMPFGWGDGGGGPAREHLEYLRRARDLDGCPKVRYLSLREHFAELEEQGYPDARYVGELYYTCHRGTYTSQAKTKKGNRRSELGLREAELWGALAMVDGDFTFPVGDIDEAWKTVLLNQFHDIIPGSSIHAVYEEAEQQYAEVIAQADSVASAAVDALSDSAGDAVSVWNALSWDRRAVVELPTGWAGATDADGDLLCVQDIEGRKIVETVVPSMGTAPLRKADQTRQETCDREPCAVRAEAGCLENELIRAEFNSLGELTTLVHKPSGREYLAGPSNQFRLFKDVPAKFDAWDIDSMYEQLPVELPAEAEVSVVASGPLMGVLRVERAFGDSRLRQDIVLRRDSEMLEFRTHIDWHERHKLLKVAFQTNIQANEALHEIQFGHVSRPNHRSRPFDADRFEVCNHRWSALAEGRRCVAVLNDCKYGVSTLGGTMQLTLLKSALGPDPQADQGEQEFTYAVGIWDEPLCTSDVVRRGYELNVPPRISEGLTDRASWLSVDADNVIIETVKPAEDGSGDVIVRLYECMRTATEATLTCRLPIAQAELTDMAENAIGPLDVDDASRVAMGFRAFEIKTVRLKLR